VTRELRPADPEWPARLSELGPHPPPTRLFAAGAPLEAERPAVAVVGTRRPTGAGVQSAYEIAGGFAEAGWTVVSGLAVGIDAMAHRAALEASGLTVAVLGCGLDVDFPARNVELRRTIAERGTLLTEYPPGTPPERRNFPRRNRLIAGLGLGVVVVEGSLRSGALVTARLALDADRSVYAVPGSCRNPMAEGPNELIRTSQAALVTSAAHVFEDLAPALAWAPAADATSGHVPACSKPEGAVLAALDDSPLAPDSLAEGLGLRAGRLAVTLSQMEVKGWVVRSRGGYALTTAGARVRSRLPPVPSDARAPAGDTPPRRCSRTDGAD
jgi:DNA processing protein